MEFRPHALEGVYEVHGAPFVDARGFQTKPYNHDDFAARGFDAHWRQVIYNHSDRANTVRGLYVQKKPFTEGKLTACVRGAVFWVVVDVRKGSPTFGKWAGVRLTPESGCALLTAPGFAHGCLSLSDNSALLLLADNSHSPEHGVSIAWNDAAIGIEWPLQGAQPIISAAHASAMSFATFRSTVGGI
jgi:dTDP-4-dehydrorhamnose 3,5-epimerase